MRSDPTRMKKAVIVTIISVVIAVAVFGLGGHDGHRPSPRTIAEIHALSAALESYKSDHGSYPSDPFSTELLKPNGTFDPASYIKESQFLYRALSGDEGQGADGKDSPERKIYFEFKRQMLRTGEAGGIYIVDSWGNSYGYSTFKSVHPGSPDGNNREYDLWSTGGGKREKDKSKWTRNW